MALLPSCEGGVEFGEINVKLVIRMIKFQTDTKHSLEYDYVGLNQMISARIHR